MYWYTFEGAEGEEGDAGDAGGGRIVRGRARMSSAGHLHDDDEDRREGGADQERHVAGVVVGEFLEQRLDVVASQLLWAVEVGVVVRVPLPL